MNFDHRAIERRQSIQNRDGRMRIRRRIDDDPRRRPPRLLNPVDQLAFMIGLQKPDGNPQILGQRRTRLRHVIQGLAALNLRLPQPQQVKVWAVQNENRFCHGRDPVLGPPDDTRFQGWNKPR